LALDSTHAAGWHSLAATLGEQSGMAEAIPAWRRAVALNPRYEEAVAFLALGHYWQRRYDSAATWADSSLALDPTYLLGRSSSGFIAASQGNFARARAAFEAAHRVSTDVEAANSAAGIALAAAGAGNRDEALALLAAADSQLAEYKPMPGHSAVYFSQAAAALGDLDRALAYLRAYQPRADTHFQLHLRCDPLFDPLAGDDRFKALLMRPRPGPQAGC
jgi:tetratricopeptide (TPR) repeat protein